MSEIHQNTCLYLKFEIFFSIFQSGRFLKKLPLKLIFFLRIFLNISLTETKRVVFFGFRNFRSITKNHKNLKIVAGYLPIN
jgi:hypothetical protein